MAADGLIVWPIGASLSCWPCGIPLEKETQTKAIAFLTSESKLNHGLQDHIIGSSIAQLDKLKPGFNDVETGLDKAKQGLEEVEAFSEAEQKSLHQERSPSASSLEMSRSHVLTGRSLHQRLTEKAPARQLMERGIAVAVEPQNNPVSGIPGRSVTSRHLKCQAPAQKLMERGLAVVVEPKQRPVSGILGRSLTPQQPSFPPPSHLLRSAESRIRNCPVSAKTVPYCKCCTCPESEVMPHCKLLHCPARQRRIIRMITKTCKGSVSSI